ELAHEALEPPAGGIPHIGGDPPDRDPVEVSVGHHEASVLAGLRGSEKRTVFWGPSPVMTAHPAAIWSSMKIPRPVTESGLGSSMRITPGPLSVTENSTV